MTDVQPPTRLSQLLNLRHQLDREISRERAAAERLEKIERDALATLTRGPWNIRAFAAACHYFGVEQDQMASGARDTPVVNARHVFMWLLRNSGCSFPEIGTELGMDHTSAVYGVRRVEKDKTLMAAAAAIHAALTGDDLTADAS